jgi:hypothetical protein
MADDKWIDGYRRTRASKLSAMGVRPGEFKYDKAARLGHAPYRSQPDFKPPDESRPQSAGEGTQNDQRQGNYYDNDVGHRAIAKFW